MVPDSCDSSSPLSLFRLPPGYGTEGNPAPFLGTRKPVLVPRPEGNTGVLSWIPSVGGPCADKPARRKGTKNLHCCTCWFRWCGLNIRTVATGKLPGLALLNHPCEPARAGCSSPFTTLGPPAGPPYRAGHMVNWLLRGPCLPSRWAGRGFGCHWVACFGQLQNILYVEITWEVFKNPPLPA